MWGVVRISEIGHGVTNRYTTKMLPHGGILTPATSGLVVLAV